jgi:hypothetical protein
MAHSDAASSLSRYLILQMLLDDVAQAASLLIPTPPAAVVSSHLLYTSPSDNEKRTEADLAGCIKQRWLSKNEFDPGILSLCFNIRACLDILCRLSALNPT